MTENYVTLSLETHLFFSRIMKEHSLFLTAGFPCKNSDWIQRADYFRKEFEELLLQVVEISNGRVNKPILRSNELITEFTLPAEQRTQFLTGVPINTEITRMEQLLQATPEMEHNRELERTVQQLNHRALQLLNGLIQFKESILREVEAGRLFTANYPLLIQHIIREAKLYRSSVEGLTSTHQVSYRMLLGTEEFWNQIMMEHALFIRGLLDPTEESLIQTANDIAMDFEELLEMARTRDFMVMQGTLSQKSLIETIKIRDFKAAGTQGILSTEIASIILPLLADHVLREANHYIRILKTRTF